MNNTQNLLENMNGMSLQEFMRLVSLQTAESIAHYVNTRKKGINLNNSSNDVIVMEDIPLNVDDVTQINGSETENVEETDIEVEDVENKIDLNTIFATRDVKLIKERREIISSRNSKRAVSDIDKVGVEHYKEPVQTVIQLYVNGKAKKTIIEFESISSCIKSLTGCSKKSNICNKFIQRLKSKEFEGFTIENEPNAMWKIIEISGMSLDEYKEHKRNQKRQKSKDKNAENTQSDVNVANNTETEVKTTKDKKSKKHKKAFKYTYNEDGNPSTTITKTYNKRIDFINEHFGNESDEMKNKIKQRLSSKKSFGNWTEVRVNK